MQIKGLASAAAPTENSSAEQANLRVNEKIRSSFDNNQINGNVQDNNNWGNSNKTSNNKRTGKRSSPNLIQTNNQSERNSQSPPSLGVTDPKRSKFNNLPATTVSGITLSHQSTDRISNPNRGNLLESTENSNHLQSNFDARVPAMASSSFEGSTSTNIPSFSLGPPSLLRIKEEGSNSNSMSEHVVIPTDPSFMRGMWIK